MDLKSIEKIHFKTKHISLKGVAFWKECLSPAILLMVLINVSWCYLILTCDTYNVDEKINAGSDTKNIPLITI